MSDQHELDVQNFYPAVLNLLIQNLAETRATQNVLIAALSNYDEKLIAEKSKAISDATKYFKKEITEKLYESYGYLPPDILGEEI